MAFPPILCHYILFTDVGLCNWKEIKERHFCQATGTGTWDLGPGTWDLGPGTWDLGPGNRIENRE